ncbi:MAG: beta-propeller domain-containing protein [Gammaproteobacteria bacterium]|nr:beta-propeller domain-containing protein [Gammaproteobacteria bacterium]
MKTSFLNQYRISPLLGAIVLLIIFTTQNVTKAGIADNSSNVQQTLQENQQKWQQSGINRYQFTVQKTCFCPLSDTLPIIFTVNNNQVIDSRYDCSKFQFIRPEPLCDEKPAARFDQTVDSLFQIILDGIDNNADKITVDYDLKYGFPSQIGIDFIELAADDEVSYLISDFKKINSESFSAKTSVAMINHQWKSLSIPIDNPDTVVFYSAPSSVGSDRGVVRLRKGVSSYEGRFGEWTNHNGVHVDELIHLITTTTGYWRFENNQIEVGTAQVSGTEQWHTINFSGMFSTPPQVITSLQTANGGDGVSVRVRNITQTSMQVQLVEQDSKKFSGHVTEVLAFLAIASSSDSFSPTDGIDIKLPTLNNPMQINHQWLTVMPGYQLRLEEDQTSDQEVFHLLEHLHLIKVGPVLLSQLVSDIGNDNAVLRAKTDFSEALNQKQQVINQLTSDKRCDSTAQCKEIAFGSKPCGGPWSYLVFSNRQTDESGLTTEVTDYNELQRLQNEIDGAVSDCAVVTPSFPVCSNNQCVPGEQPPPSSSAANLTRFNSDVELEAFIKQGLKATPGFSTFEVAFSPGIPIAFSPAPSTDTNNSFSTTNIQESGVHEADFIKSDGNFMYVGDPVNKQIRILQMFRNPYRAVPQASIEAESENSRLNGLYLLSDRGQNRPDLLTTIRSDFKNAQPVDFAIAPLAPLDLWYYPWYWMNQETKISLFNVSTPSNPQLLKTLTIDGTLLASRLIDEALYVVTRFVPDIQPLLDPAEQTPELREQNINVVIDQAKLSDLLPTVTITNGQQTGLSAPLINTQQTFLPTLPEPFHSSDLLTISRFDLSNPDSLPQTTTLVGSSDTVYVSKKALYIATSIYGYEKSIGILNAVRNGTPPPEDVEIFIPRHTTQIHKIKLTAEQPEYSGSGSVEGLLTGNDDLRRFRFSENEDTLRVVTTGQWGEMGEHRVTILQENQDGNLLEVSHLPNQQRPQRIGKPNEQLHATRYVNDRLFIVTFLKIDPLITVDLSDMFDPKIEGELEIPGYSDYLHPINENLLLGVGKHTSPAEGRGDGRFAWFQGIRLGLFDVSSTGAAKELDTVVIGERGSESDLLYDIHAFSFLPASQPLQQPFKFTIPVSIIGETFPSLTITDPTAFKDWSHTGLFLFEVDPTAADPSFKHIGEIKSGQPDSSQQFQDSSVGTNRAVLFDDGLFYSHNQKIWSSNWITPELAVGPQ